MEGLKVKGIKTTTHLAPAAGKNEQSRMLVASTWTSEELHIDVLKEIDEVGKIIEPFGW